MNGGLCGSWCQAPICPIAFLQNSNMGSGAVSAGRKITQNYAKALEVIGSEGLTEETHQKQVS